MEHRLTVSHAELMETIDYHFLIQLSNGEWAHKRGQTASAQLGAVNPTTLAWNWSGGPNYNSSTIYFVVQAESSSFSW
ncbi:MAG: hypothetical protein RR483_01375 [Clostridia bacterium]